MPMNFSAKGGGEDFKRVPAGTHLAVCNLVADVGIQPGSGMYPDPKHQIYVRWEIPGERTEYEKDGKKMEGPMTIGRFYTASMGTKSNLRKDLESWRNKAFTDEEAESFDVGSILGKACLLNVVNTEKGEKTYANVKGVSGLIKGMAAQTAENPLLYYAPDDKRKYEDLPKWLKEKIDGQLDAAHAPSPAASREAADEAMAQQYQAASDEFGDSIPFAPLHKRALWF